MSSISASEPVCATSWLNLERVRKGAKLVPLISEEPLKDRQVAFKFVDEYWNDELRSYRFSLKSRCIEESAR